MSDPEQETTPYGERISTSRSDASKYRATPSASRTSSSAPAPDRAEVREPDPDAEALPEIWHVGRTRTTLSKASSPNAKRTAMSNIFKPRRHAELLGRLGTLSPESERRWGRMTPHQAVCHLNDSFKAVLRDRPVELRDPDLKRRVMRVFAFTLPFPWPKGVPTSRDVDAERGGTPPGDFEADVEELRQLLRRFVDTDGRGIAPHYAWGAMSRGEWGRYGYRHVDHHLRQFGA